ncbi:MAG: hypothetical protein HY744_04210 [Deltaproteobacteria bacterium]|nr:hypothetical protein [Deltaproteobacteria bacterium]
MAFAATKLTRERLAVEQRRPWLGFVLGQGLGDGGPHQLGQFGRGEYHDRAGPSSGCTSRG